MAKELRRVIVYANGKKMDIPDPSKIIVSVRDAKLQQHQASMDITVPNVNQLKKIVVRRGT